MKDFELDQVAKFRTSESDRFSQMSGDADLENMHEHYKYLIACSSNAMRESIFAFKLPSPMTYVPEGVKK